VTFKFLHQCWVGPQIAVLPVVPRGQNDLTTTGILADGVVAFVKKATVDFNCNHCDAGTSSADADVVLDGGAADVSDNGTTSVSTPGGSGESCNCSTSRGPTTSLMPWITALTAITFARRRRR
jgi:MYXO-CTERM domain-containing protein